MPKSEREWAQRKLNQIKGHIDICGQNAFEIHEVYVNPHPEIANMMQSIMQFCTMLLELVDEIKKSF